MSCLIATYTEGFVHTMELYIRNFTSSTDIRKYLSFISSICGIEVKWSRLSEKEYKTLEDSGCRYEKLDFDWSREWIKASVNLDGRCYRNRLVVLTCIRYLQNDAGMIDEWSYMVKERTSLEDKFNAFKTVHVTEFGDDGEEFLVFYMPRCVHEGVSQDKFLSKMVDLKTFQKRMVDWANQPQHRTTSYLMQS